ncbi:MAG TPA: DUF885 domain-containing protein [Candidatus Saccharimonadales bacterium]|nr:DUF885 domain-containing protein [Candidatus Saccharimonadales bacterium]
MDYRALMDELLNDFFRLQPVSGTEIGSHRHDSEWPDLTDAGRQAWRDWLVQAEARLGALEAGPLTRNESIDRRIVLDNLAAMRFSAEELREHEWNPLSYVYLFGNGLFSLLAREFAPLPVRLASATARLRGLPAAIAAAQATLAAGGTRPVSRFHTEQAVERMPGVAELVTSALDEAKVLGDAAVMEPLQAAAAEANAAIEGFIAWLRDDLLRTAAGDFRLGPELYAAKFRHALQSDLTPGELEATASAEYDRVRAEMARLAHEIWPTWLDDAEPPADDDQAVRAVLDAIAADHPRPEELLDFCRAENARIEAFVAERDLVGLADEPMQIIWTPQFMRSFGGAMLIQPGPLDGGLDSFFAITPMPEDWSAQRKESYLREDNARMLRLLTIHEAVPGHYLQLAYANHCPSVLRAIFFSGVFAEGWAVYITQVMMDVGYGADDPALMLVHWKFYLRSITNTLMDIRIHSGSMDEAEAMHLMVDGGFQEEGEAANKWNRARLSSTQLCEYFLGSVEMHELEAEARRRAAAEGQEFVYRPFLESVLAHGTPALPVIREILFGA